MNIETLKSSNPRNRKSISVIKSKFLSFSSMNTLLAILKVTDARRDVILAGGLYHRFPWRDLPPLPPLNQSPYQWKCVRLRFIELTGLNKQMSPKSLKYNICLTLTKMKQVKQTLQTSFVSL